MFKRDETGNAGSISGAMRERISEDKFVLPTSLTLPNSAIRPFVDRELNESYRAVILRDRDIDTMLKLVRPHLGDGLETQASAMERSGDYRMNTANVPQSELIMFVPVMQTTAEGATPWLAPVDVLGLKKEDGRPTNEVERWISSQPSTVVKNPPYIVALVGKN